VIFHQTADKTPRQACEALSAVVSRQGQEGTIYHLRHHGFNIFNHDTDETDEKIQKNLTKKGV
jgi:hypothetical protein